MSAQFAPRRPDGRSAARVVADYLGGRIDEGALSPGDTITHEELTAAAEMDRDPTYYQAVGKAAKILEQEYGRSLRSRRGIGYTLIAGIAQLEKGRSYQDRSRRNLQRGHGVVATIDAGTLGSDDERTLVLGVQKGMANIIAILRIQAERLANHDEQINYLKRTRIEDKARVRATEDQVTELRERLDRIEREKSGS